MTSHFMRNNVSAILERCIQFDGEYGAHLSNHLPMVIVAMDRLGAKFEQIEDFYRIYIERLRKRTAPTLTLNKSTWLEYLGKHGHHSDFALFFAQEASQLGIAGLLRQYLPTLCKGIAAGAFHGLIRTAYGIDTKSETEVVEGLAHWADASLEIDGGIFSQACGSDEPALTLGKLRRVLKWRGNSIGGPNIFSRMAIVGDDLEFQTIVGSTEIHKDSLLEISRIALAVFAATRDFTALHMVTSAHAMRIVLPYCENPISSLRSFWVAIAAAYVTIKCPDLEVLPSLSGNIPDWTRISVRALASLDDHTIKLAYSCMEEAKHYGEPLFQLIAARRVGFNV